MLNTKLLHPKMLSAPGSNGHGSKLLIKDDFLLPIDSFEPENFVIKSTCTQS